MSIYQRIAISLVFLKCKMFASRAVCPHCPSTLSFPLCLQFTSDLTPPTGKLLTPSLNEDFVENLSTFVIIIQSVSTQDSAMFVTLLFQLLALATSTPVAGDIEKELYLVL